MIHYDSQDMIEGGWWREPRRWSHSTRPGRTSPGSGTTGWAGRTTSRPTDPGLTELIDLAQPACVILSAILHFADAGKARDVAAIFARAVVPGSYLIISCGSGNRSEGENFASEYTAARVYIHSLEEIQGFFDGLELVPPGVVPVRLWNGDGPALDVQAPTATFIGGVARKP
jgi:S-adenosyl methyltransferase